MTASIDFLEEVGRPERLEFPIVEILHIEDEKGRTSRSCAWRRHRAGRTLAAADSAGRFARAARAAGRRDRVSRPGPPGARRPS